MSFTTFMIIFNLIILLLVGLIIYFLSKKFLTKLFNWQGISTICNPIQMIQLVATIFVIIFLFNASMSGFSNKDIYTLLRLSVTIDVYKRQRFILMSSMFCPPFCKCQK